MIKKTKRGNDAQNMSARAKADTRVSRRNFLMQAAVVTGSATASLLLTGGQSECVSEEPTCEFTLRDALKIEGILQVREIPFEDTENGHVLACGDWVYGFAGVPEDLRFWVSGNWVAKHVSAWPVRQGEVVEIENAVTRRIEYAFAVRTSCLEPAQTLMLGGLIAPGTNYSPAATQAKINGWPVEGNSELLKRRLLPPRHLR